MAMQQLSSLDFNSQSRILNLLDGVALQEPATVAQLNAVTTGLGWKDNVRAASTVNVTLTAPGATLDTVVLASGDRILLKDQTLPAANGIYVWTGLATALTRPADADTFNELESAVVCVDNEPAASNAGTTWRQTAVNGTIDVTPQAWSAFGTSVPAASETVAGIAELATQAETDAGTDDLRIVTPLKLATWSNRRKLFESIIGDGVSTSFAVTHNLNSFGVDVTVYRNSGNRDTIGVEVQRTSVNAVTVVFAAAPALNSFNVLVTR